MAEKEGLGETHTGLLRAKDSTHQKKEKEICNFARNYIIKENPLGFESRQKKAPT